MLVGNYAVIKDEGRPLGSAYRCWSKPP